MELLIGKTPHEQAVNILGKKIAGYRIGVAGLPEDVRKEYKKVSYSYWNVYKQRRRMIPGLEERYKFHRTRRNPYYSRMPKAQLSKTTPTIITSETKSYQGMGFSKPQSQYLAKQGAKQGISFTSRGARQVIQQQRRLPIEIKRLPKRKAVAPICILKPTEMRKLKFTPISRLSPTERITLKGPVDRLIEKSSRLISEIKRKGPTSKLMREKKSLLNELSKKEVRLGATKETLDLVGKRRELIRTEKPSPTRESKLITLTVATSLIGFGLGMKQLITHPVSSIKSIPSSLKEEVEEVGFLIRVSPTEAIAKIGTEILLLKGTGKALTVTGKVGGKLRARLSPKFKGVKGNTITIPSQVRGKTIKIKIGGPVKKLAEPLREQVRLAGKEVVGVSAQADRLVRLIKRTKIVRKPIPGEAKLSKTTKILLKKFDERRIGKRDLIRLDRRIRQETRGAGNLLERSFFADPRGRLRPSRLGIVEKEASLRDILKGDVTFKTQKPQVLIFEKVLVEKFPKALKGIERKLKAGKTLTRNEANKLLQFQLKKSAKFKPVGHLTREPEISLAPGEIIKKGKTIAVTIIQGKRVPIIRAKVVKAKPGTKILLNKAKTGKITTSELKRLRVNLRKETGFKTSLSRGRIGKPRVRIPKPIPRRPPKRRPPKRRVIPRRRIPRRKPPRRRPVPRRRIPKRPRRPPKRPPRRPPVRPPRRPVRRPPRRPPIRPPGRPPIKPVRPFPRRRIGRRRKVMKPQAYEVWARPLKPTKKGRKPKLIKISKVPLSKKRARDLRNYITDTSLSRTALIRPISGKPSSTPKLKVPKGYSRKTYAKFRGYRIVKGKRVPIQKERVIEKRRHLLDTIQEKKQITLRRRITQLSKPRRLPKRRPSPKRKTIKRRKSSRRSGGIFDF